MQEMARKTDQMPRPKRVCSQSSTTVQAPKCPCGGKPEGTIKAVKNPVIAATSHDSESAPAPVSLRPLRPDHLPSGVSLPQICSVGALLPFTRHGNEASCTMACANSPTDLSECASQP